MRAMTRKSVTSSRRHDTSCSDGAGKDGQIGCSFGDEFANAFGGALDNYEAEDFFEELVINAIGGGIGRALAVYLKGAMGGGGRGYHAPADLVGRP